MKRHPLTGISLILAGLFLRDHQHSGLVGHWLIASLNTLVGSFGTSAVTYGLILAGLAASGFLHMPGLALRFAAKWAGRRLWLHQVRRAPKVAPRPLATKPIASREPPSAQKAMTHIEKEVRGGLASLGYSKAEIDRTIISLDLRFLSTEKALRNGLTLLRKAN